MSYGTQAQSSRPSWDAGPIGFQVEMFWGLVSQVQSLKAEVPNVGFEPSAPQEKAPGFEFSLCCGLLCRGWVYGEIMSQ